MADPDGNYSRAQSEFDKLNRRSSGGSGERNKLEYMMNNNNSRVNNEFNASITNSIANSIATKKMGNVHHPRSGGGGTSADQSLVGGQTAVTDSKTEKTSSISSSSSGSRRRNRERERHQLHRSLTESDGDRITPIMEVGGDNFVQELKSNNENFAAMIGAERGGRGSRGDGTITTSHSGGDRSRGSDNSRDLGESHNSSHSKDRERDREREIRNSGGRDRGDGRGDGRLRTKKTYDTMDWPSTPPDAFMEDLPRRKTSSNTTASERSHHGSQHSERGGGNMHQAAPPQSQHYPAHPPVGERSPGAAPPRARAVLHACDDKGRCLFHPQVVLRKKVILGVMGGWKDVLASCPLCESEDMAGGGLATGMSAPVGGGKGAGAPKGRSRGNPEGRAHAKQGRQVKFGDYAWESADGSGSSREFNSSREQVLQGLEPRGTLQRHRSDYGSYLKGEEGDEESDSDGDSSSGDSSDSSGSSSSASSSSSSEEEQPVGRQNLGNSAQSGGSGERWPPRPRAQPRGGAPEDNIWKKKAPPDRGRGANNRKPKKTNLPAKSNDDFISAYIGSGVPSRTNQKYGQSKALNRAKESKDALRRPPSDATSKYPQTLSPDNSMESSAAGSATAFAPTQQPHGGKKMLQGVSKLIKKSKKRISKAVDKATQNAIERYDGAIRTHTRSHSFEEDFDNCDYSEESDIEDGYDMCGSGQEEHQDSLERSQSSLPMSRRGQHQNEESHPSRQRQRQSEEPTSWRRGKERPHGELPPPPLRQQRSKEKYAARPLRRDRSKERYPSERPPRRRSKEKYLEKYTEKYPERPQLLKQQSKEEIPSQPQQTRERKGHSFHDKPQVKRDPSGLIIVSNRDLGQKRGSDADDRHGKGWGRGAPDRLIQDGAASLSSPMRLSKSLGVNEGYNLGGAVPTIAPLDSDVAYQWDRVPFPGDSMRDLATEASASDEDLSEEDSSEEDSSEEDSHEQRLQDVAYQWDRVPLPVETTNIEEGESPPSNEPEVDDKAMTNSEQGQHQIQLDERNRMQTQQHEGIGSHESDLEKLSYDAERRKNQDEVDITAGYGLNRAKQRSWRTAPEAESERSLSPSSELGTIGNTGRDSDNANSCNSINHSKTGVLSMEDLLQSIQEDINMNCNSTFELTQIDRNASTPSSAVGGGSFNNSANDYTATSMPQLDRSATGFSSRENSSSQEFPLDVSGSSGDEDSNKVSLDSKIELLKTLVAEETVSEPKRFPSESSRSDEETSEEEKEEEVKPLPQPPPLPGFGNYGGLKIDLSALQASKPSGGLKIDLSSLEASKPSKKPEPKEIEKPIKRDDQSNHGDAAQPPPPTREVDKSVKTFDVNNLPYTGQFGESGMYTGSVSEQYEPHGKGTMVYDNGEILTGYWNIGELLRKSELYSDDEDDDEDEDDDGEMDDLSSSMANIGTRSSSRSRSRSREPRPEPPPPPPPPKPRTPSPPLPEYKVGDPGKHRDMIMDKDESLKLIEHLKFGDGAFIRRSDGKWTYAVVKSIEETEAGKVAIRFLVNDRSSSKSYAKKYWGTHVRPLKGMKLPPPPDQSLSSESREGRTKQRDGEPSSKATSDAKDQTDRGRSCPPTQSKLSFDWGMGPPVRHGRSRSRSRRRAVSFSPMRALTSIAESDVEYEEDEEEDSEDATPQPSLPAESKAAVT